MIYLIDDNQYEQNKLSDIKSETLRIISKIPKRGNYDYLNHLNYLNNANCILLHDGTEDVDNNGNFINGSHTNVLKIKEDICKNGKKIPLVIFSLGMSEEAEFNPEKTPNCIYAINKKIFYRRLGKFLDKYTQTGQVDLNLIAYGENAELHKLRLLSDEILKKISGLDTHKELSLSNVPIDKLRRYLEILLPQRKYNDILNQIEDEKITIKDYKEKINSFFNSYKNYGKNIYDW